MTRKVTQLTKLQELSTARADRVETLEHHVRDMLQKMSSFCGGSSVTVDGWTLSYEYLASSVADDDQDLFWIFGEEGVSEVVALDAYYLPERPDSRVVFPDRASLVKFAQLSDKFVAALIEDREKDIGELDAAIAKVRAAKPAA